MLNETQSVSKMAHESKLQVGDLVQVRSAEFIMTTLDENGALDGVPFMPEMLRFCEQQFRVARVTHSVCVNEGSVSIRGLADCVVLKMLNRCDGLYHGDCQLGCMFFWKTSWLAHVAENDDSSTRAASSGDLPSKGAVLQRLIPLTTVTTEHGRESRRP